jgi:hypothetical protein
MGKMLERIGNIDRRIIFVLMALAVIIPLALKLSMEMPVGEGPSYDLYEHIDQLPADSRVLMSFDYDPSTKPELQPMARALVTHMLSTDLNIVAMALWPQGATLGQRVLSNVSDSLGAEQYSDWVNLGYKTGGPVLIVRLGSSLEAAFPTDLEGVPYGEIPMLSDISTLRDFDLVVTLSAGDPGIPAWVMIASDRFGIPVGGGCTAVSAPQFYPYLQQREGERPQMEGLLGGLRGAADYETLIERPALAAAGMSAQSIAHLVIMVFIVIGNVTYFATRDRKKKGGRR